MQARKRFAKLELYRKFTNALALAVIVAVLWIGYEVMICPITSIFLPLFAHGAFSHFLPLG
jgi:hypothetical protein